MKESRVLSGELKTEAIGFGLCGKWTEEWDDDSSRGELLDKLIHKWGIAWHIKYDWPSVDFIKDNFDRELLLCKHICVEGNWIESDCEQGNYLVEGDANAMLYMNNVVDTSVYMRGNARLNLIVSGMSIVYVELHDNARARIENIGTGKVVVHCLSKESSAVGHGNVLVRDKK